MEAPSKVAEECKAKITAFQELLPLINAICNQGLHERHWEKIATVAGFDVRPDEVTSLRRLLDYNIQDHVKVCGMYSILRHDAYGLHLGPFLGICQDMTIVLQQDLVSLKQQQACNQHCTPSTAADVQLNDAVDTGTLSCSLVMLL